MEEAREDAAAMEMSTEWEPQCALRLGLVHAHIVVWLAAVVRARPHSVVGDCGACANIPETLKPHCIYIYIDMPESQARRVEEAREDAAAMEMSTEWESDGEPNWYSSSA